MSLNFFGTDCAQVFNFTPCPNVRNTHGVQWGILYICCFSNKTTVGLEERDSMCHLVYPQTAASRRGSYRKSPLIWQSPRRVASLSASFRETVGISGTPLDPSDASSRRAISTPLCAEPWASAVFRNQSNFLLAEQSCSRADSCSTLRTNFSVRIQGAETHGDSSGATELGP
eukprot:COSAG02_NODE_304_length_25204_cov_11.025095_6_plen_172_part_00